VSLAQITDELVADLAGLRFGSPVALVYDPLVYARQPWDRYCERYGRGTREILFYGMNPGPFGMAQVGVPFGEVALVRDWLGIEAPVGKPAREHPKRPVQGFACRRSEVSGARFWGWAKERYGTPEAFFERHFVANYCPLVFMGESGVNITPDKLPKAEREPLFAACDRAVQRTVALFEPKVVIGVGKFAADRLRAALEGAPGLTVGRVPHPSPASPLANTGWAELMDRELARFGGDPAGWPPVGA